jgi:hypothetical protein
MKKIKIRLDQDGMEDVITFDDDKERAREEAAPRAHNDIITLDDKCYKIYAYYRVKKLGKWILQGYVVSEVRRPRVCSL